MRKMIIDLDKVSLLFLPFNMSKKTQKTKTKKLADFRVTVNIF